MIIKPNKGLILAIGACVGVVATAYFSAKAGVKVDKDLKDAQAKKDEELTRIEELEEQAGEKKEGEERTSHELTTGEKLKATWKDLAIPAACATFTVGCIIFSHVVNMKQLAALGGTAAFLAANRDKLENEIEKRFGKDTLHEVKESVLKQMGPTEDQRHSAEKTGNGDLLCLEAYSGRWFRSSKDHVDWALKRFNEIYKSERVIQLNELYDLLNISRNQFGHSHGWSMLEKDFGDNPPIFLPVEFETDMVEDGELFFEEEYFEGGEVSMPHSKCNEPVYIINISEDTEPTKLYFPSCFLDRSRVAAA